MPAYPPGPLHIKPSHCVAFQAAHILHLSSEYMVIVYGGPDTCREVGSTVETVHIRKLLSPENHLEAWLWRKWLTAFSLSNP